eukprot:8504799-Pyramimonas_sp.AAC.1
MGYVGIADLLLADHYDGTLGRQRYCWVKETAVETNSTLLTRKIAVEEGVISPGRQYQRPRSASLSAPVAMDGVQ